MKQDLLKIINHYGVLNQLKYIQSEFWEFSDAVFDYEYNENKNNKEKLKEHIAEEIADVEVMLMQFATYYGINATEIMKIAHDKIDRQLERIENEQV